MVVLKLWQEELAVPITGRAGVGGRGEMLLTFGRCCSLRDEVELGLAQRPRSGAD